LEGANSDTKIVDVMMHYGFTQGGKFAKEYQQLFGEKPSETLKRSSQFNQQNTPLWQQIDDPRSERVAGGVASSTDRSIFNLSPSQAHQPSQIVKRGFPLLAGLQHFFCQQ
jgi:hypothetical protein